MEQLTYSINQRVKGKSKQGHQLAASGWTQQTTDVVTMLHHHAIEGSGIMPGLLTHSGRSKEHLYEFGTLVVDVDNTDPDNQTTWDEAINNPFLQRNAVALWTSQNHKRNDGEESDYYGQDRFRILFRLPEPQRLCPAGNQKNYKEIHQLIKRLNALIPGSDPNITPIQYIAGTFNGLTHIFRMGTNTLDLSEVPELPAKPKRDHSPVVASDFTGSIDDSVNNVSRMLECIDNSEYHQWIQVCGCLTEHR